MIGVDWGTTSLRAYRLDGRRVIDRRDSTQGITSVAAGGFDAVLLDAVGDWLRAGETDVLMAGMIGSRQGWVEAPYLACPAGLDQLAAALMPVPFAAARVAIVPGLRGEDPSGTPEVMRGEETQLAGLVGWAGPAASACLPGTHSKWAIVAEGNVTNFATHMTGEIFSAVRSATILGRMMQDGPTDEPAFRRGVARAAEPGGLLHHLFGVRTQGLFGRLSALESASYLSGLLIGHEIEAARPAGTVHLIGAPALCSLYSLALEQRGVASVHAPPDLATLGLAAIAERAGWN
jgi:2-dehydro-3-deoxygalactonokinase